MNDFGKTRNEKDFFSKCFVFFILTEKSDFYLASINPQVRIHM